MSFPNWRRSIAQAPGPLLRSVRETLFVGLGLIPFGYAWAQPPEAPVVAVKVIERRTMQGQSSVATVMPSRRVTVGSAVSGRVAKFLVNEGDRVEQGQALAQLLVETISADIVGAAAERELREQELLELERGTRPEEIARDEAKMMAAKATSDYLESRRQRVERLFSQGSTVTAEQRDEAVAAADTAIQNYREATSQFELSKAGPRREKIAQAKARLAMHNAMLEKLNDQLKKHTIISRFSGYVTAEHTEEGAWLNPGDPVADVAALDEVDVEAYVVENSIRHVNTGMPVRVEVLSMPELDLLGKVALIVPQADLRARTFPVKIRVVNRIEAGQPMIKSGMSVRVFLPTGDNVMSLLVPKDALVLNARQRIVYVIVPSKESPKASVAQPVPVELGAAVGNWIQVTGQLRAGQEVVVQGNERLRPGQSVRVDKVLSEEPNLETRSDLTPASVVQ
ncbi:MAG: efflux RND transporter periplasmic adaptor subunit [Planctomycetota bacterium]|nr:efflux RND transporter periplasmic adaptor subunit [Planctomycetota bacterium]MDA1180379.1 efflux RND transporter periplasmic adaptor subunit [Planctomycetota bacterium]